MPTREDPRLTLRLDSALDGRLDGAARGAAVKKGTLARRAIELGLDAAIEEARFGRGPAVAQARGEIASPAARGGRLVPGVAGARKAGRLDDAVAAVTGGMLEARRAINAGLVRVDGVVVRDPMTLVPAGARVVVES